MRSQWVTPKRFWGFLAALVLAMCLTTAAFAQEVLLDQAPSKLYAFRIRLLDKDGEQVGEDDSNPVSSPDQCVKPDFPLADMTAIPEGMAPVWSLKETVTETEETGDGIVEYTVLIYQCTGFECADGNHTFGDWVQTKDPTCTEKGEKKRTCTKEGCDAFETQDVDSLGHKYGEAAYEWAKDKSTVTGTKTCTRNPDHEKLTETVNTTKAVTPPTCTEKGSITYTATFTKEDFTTQTETVDGDPATDHDYADPTYVWSEDNKTVTGTRICNNDADHKITETVETTSSTTAPTCTEKGTITYTAAFTKEGFTTQTKTVDGDPATGHKLVQGVQTKESRDKGDTVCTGYDVEIYCTNNGCDYTTTGHVDGVGHSMDDWAMIEADQEAGKTACTGYTERRACTAEGCSYSETREVAAQHDLEHHDAQTATCTEKGWEAYDTCKREGCDYTTFTETDALGHDFGEWVESKPATTTEKGEEKRTCQREGCDAYETREIDMLEPDHEHDWGDWVLVTPPSCNSKGVYIRTCKVDGCDILTETRYVDPDPSAHEWSQWILTTDPTCTKMGVETRICKDCTLTETRPVDMLPHTQEIIPAVPATCLESGSTEGSKCSVCGTILVEPDSTDPIGHDWGPWVTVAEPTEDAFGMNERICRNDSSHKEDWRLPKLKNEVDGLAEGIGGVLEDILLHRTNISGDPVYVHTGEGTPAPLVIPEEGAAEGTLTLLGQTGISIVLPADLQARVLKEEQIEEEGILGCYVNSNGSGVLVLDADLEVTDLSVYRAVVEKAGGLNIQDLTLNGRAAFSYCLPDRDAVYLATNNVDGVLLEIAFFSASDEAFMQEAGLIAATLK